MEPEDQQKQLYYKTYSDALCTNEAETSQWTMYRQEHVELKNNLQMYRNTPKADILIPIGTKAFIAGQLYQTGEVLVSHGCGYFSECSSEQAESVADRRIHLANEFLQKYERERSLYNDKLKVPLVSEAFWTDNNGQEIIEAYDEEAENRWREEHSHRVRESKQREAKERRARSEASQEINDEPLFAQLDEMELLEVLENEMAQLELSTGENDVDLLDRLIRGEIRLKEQTRIAHEKTESLPHVQTAKVNLACIQQLNNTDSPSVVEENLEEQIETTDDDDGENDDDEDDVTIDFSQLLNETKNNTNKEKIKRFQAKLKEVRQRLYENSLDVVQKVDLYQLHDELEEALEFLLPLNESDDEYSTAKWKKMFKENDVDEARKVKFAELEQIKLISNRYQEQPGEQTLLNDSKNTLFLPIQHGKSINYYKPDSIDEIVSPADIYRKFLADEVFYKQSQFSDLKSILKNHKTNHPSPERHKKQTRENDVPKISEPDLLGQVVEHGTVDVLIQEVHMQSMQKSQEKRKISRFKQQRN
ncbi:unconventional prefoldin RPB5 interactor-like protein [Anopheles maculipalpis]|uniref:unconventional prefoldin RPB5 interactor-like protein n=1 Tax=Anopheles maculipalpis TaxID=1496333 RepID=UPI0021599E47|nr:unconventional prefoldin RPB5 interactor-like protein [Anopheles maculipalpis]